MKFGPGTRGSSNPLDRRAGFWCRTLSVSLALAVAGQVGFVGSNLESRAQAKELKRSEVRPRKKKLPKARPHKRRHRTSSGAGLVRGPPGAPAGRYAALDAADCHAELERRGVSFRIEPNAHGVKIPVRLTGPVAGVLYRTDLPDEARHTAPWEVYDCRLVLSLSDFGPILDRYGVVEARIFSAWRPPFKRTAPTIERRHPGALAVDVRSFKKASGEELIVLEHFPRAPGKPVCKKASPPTRPKADELYAIVCAAAEAHIFNSILTPNYDAEHKNHFHLELTPGVSWFMVR